MISTIYNTETYRAEGQKARKEGKPQHANPYDYRWEGLAANAWDDGWKGRA